MALTTYAQDIAVGKTTKQDIIIAFMGPTGSGKSHLIDTLIQSDSRKLRSGKALESCTQKIQAIRLRNHPTYDDRLVFVDTPGFDDTHRSDMEILKMVSEWLKKSYEADIKLSGIVYMHRITDNRMSGAPHRNLRMFGELCGDTAVQKVILVTTMWDLVDELTGLNREKDLHSHYWDKMIQRGAVALRFENTQESAWRIITRVADKSGKGEAVLLQEELVDLKKRLNETKAGIVIYNSLQVLLASHKKNIRELAEHAKAQDNPKIAAQLDAEYNRIQAEFEKTFTEISSLKISIPRRIALFFSKRSRARPLDLAASPI